MVPFPELLVSSQADGPALNTSTAQTSLLPGAAKAIVAANLLNVIGKRFQVKAYGRISNIVTTPGTLTLELKLGSVVIAASGAIPLNIVAKTDRPWSLVWDLTLRSIGTGTSGTFMHQGEFKSYSIIGAPAPTAGGAPVQMIPHNAAPAVGTGFDSTAAAVLDFFGTWSISNVGNNIQVHQYDVFMLN